MADLKPTPTEAPTTGGSSGKSLTKQEYDKLVRQIADKVWNLWREELRRSRERSQAQWRR